VLACHCFLYIYEAGCALVLACHCFLYIYEAGCALVLACHCFLYTYRLLLFVLIRQGFMALATAGVTAAATFVTDSWLRCFAPPLESGALAHTVAVSVVLNGVSAPPAKPAYLAAYVAYRAPQVRAGFARHFDTF